MKVLFINTNDESGGAARAAVRIMHGVQQEGVDVKMLVLNKTTQADDIISLSQFAPSNSCYRILDWLAHKIKNKWQHFKWNPYQHRKKEVYLSDLRSTNIHGALQKIDYDILHLHWINGRFLDVCELTKVKKPIVWTLHDSWAFCGVCHYFIDCEKYQTHCGSCPMLGSSTEHDLAYEIYEKKRAAYKNLDLHIVTPCRWLAECVKRSNLLGDFPITVIPNGIDTDKFRPYNSAAKNRDSVPIILYGAMNAVIDKRKGISFLLSALKILDDNGTVAKLVVFGADTPVQPLSFQHIEVSFMGYINDTSILVDLYNTADVMVVPSMTENLSNTIMESMACGTPVVAFNIGGNGDMIDHKRNGYLAENQNIADLADGICWCIENNKGNVLGAKARKKVMEKFAIPIISKQYKKLYQSL